MFKESIQTTYNYDQFSFEEWNREIDDRNLKRLAKKVEKEGWRKLPILVDTKGRVYDGQHRLLFAKQNHLPVYYTVISGLQKKDCQIMNTTQKKWEAKDYIHFYASNGDENYKKLEQLCTEYNYPASLIINALKSRGYGGVQQQRLKDGYFMLSKEEEKLLREKLNFFKKIEPYVSNLKGKVSQLYVAISFCLDCPDIDNARLYKVIKERIKTIQPPANLEWALKGIEEIYNKYIDSNNYVYIFTEYKKSVASKKSRLFR